MSLESCISGMTAMAKMIAMVSGKERFRVVLKMT
jgi:hypothetical protein